MKKIIFGLLLPALLLFSSLWASETSRFMTVDYRLSQDKIVPGKNIRLAVIFTLNHEYHINSHNPNDDFAIPTVLEIKLPEGFTLGRMVYPESHLKKFSFSDKPLDVFEGKNTIYTSITAPAEISEDSVQIDVTLSFQACNDQSCFAPDAVEKTVSIPVAHDGEEINSINGNIFASVKEQVTPPEEKNDDSGLANALQEKGMFLFLLLVFLAGLALNLTPCVYPLIPITIAYFSNQSKDNKSNVTLHAVFYFLGMVIMYSSLGLIAALSGSILGGWLQNPIVIIFIALIMFALALSMFGVWEIRVPQKLANTAGKNRVGYAGTLFMGLTVGFIAAPCIGPFVLGLITLVADIGNPLTGFIMFLALATGIGLPYLLLGIFSGAINKIPGSGGWMVWVRNLFGFVLLGMAVYFLNPLINNDFIYFLLLGLLAIGGGIYCFLDKNISFANPKAFKATKIITGLLLIAAGIFLALPKGENAESEIRWQKYDNEIYQAAINSDKPIIMDFYADWCIPCKELDKFTFTDNRVEELSSSFTMLKVNLTQNNKANNELRKKFGVKGVPTILFIDKNGNIISELSFVGFIEANEMAAKMKEALSK